MKYCILLFSIFYCQLIVAQDETEEIFRNYDYVYKNYIKSVRFYQFDSQTDYPILELNSSNYFILEFDDKEAFTKDYFYKIIHCDANWEVSEEIDAIDYIDGFQENRIYSGQNSFSTKVPYVHYEIKLPNEDVKWNLSGNYLLKVYLDDDENDLIITKRFMIVDTKMKAVAKRKASAIPPYTASHQEMQFEIQHTGFQIGNPRDQVHVVVLQNGRWDNCVQQLEPTYIRNEAIGYDMAGKIIFPGLKEFRPLDIRSFRFRTNQVDSIQEYTDGFELFLFPDRLRTYNAHVFTHDLNGRYIIESHDYPDERLQEEYAMVNFYLESKEALDGDVYILGGFTDFRPTPDLKMKYNLAKARYEASCMLKNGFYDYCYASVKKGEKPNIQKIEGSSFETENDYLFLVYYKEFGGRYDQLVAVQKLNTNPK